MAQLLEISGLNCPGCGDLGVQTYNIEAEYYGNPGRTRWLPPRFATLGEASLSPQQCLARAVALYNQGQKEASAQMALKAYSIGSPLVKHKARNLINLIRS